MRLCAMRSLGIASHFYHRFFTISGALFSLQYLSLPDATVLTYLTPTLTGFTGALFLGEVISLRESLAGCEHF
jgi:drug/metabolite transporter (DMT)-like permease